MTTIYSFVVLAALVSVVLALTLVMWRERTSMQDGRIALVGGAALAIWAVAAILRARRGALQPRGDELFPPVGWSLLLALAGLGLCLDVFPTLRRLLSRQSSLIRLHLWRFLGVLFLALMVQGQLPALFALPAGIGDILVAAAAP